VIVGGSVELPLAIALLEIEGRSFRVPVILGDQNLVGVTTLETLGFEVDPVDRKLVVKPGILFGVVNYSPIWRRYADASMRREASSGWGTSRTTIQPFP